MKVLVIKVGGAFLDHTEHALSLLKVIKQLQSHFSVVMVHGGGNGVEALLSQLGLKSQKIEGLRVTPEEHIGFVVGALAGTANKQLCSLAMKLELNSVGLCLADGQITISQKISEELGSVGSVLPGDSSLIDTLLKSRFFPIISSIGANEAGELLNVNADQAATAVAQTLNAELLLLSDVPGVLDAEHQLVHILNTDTADKYIAQNVIRDGMTVKVRAAQLAANTLNRPVTIASWKHAEQLLNLLNNEQIGTQVLPLSSQE